MWRTIHVVALGYPPNPQPPVRQAYAAFYNSLKTVIPCVTCRQGYVSIVGEHPVEEALGNPEDLFSWTVLVHNKVNQKLGKEPMSEEYVKDSYMFGDEPKPAAPVSPAARKAVAVYALAFLLVILVAWAVYAWVR